MQLDELEGLPGETTANKTALWQKLEGRLQKKPKQTKVIWYWAAACLLICASVSFFFNASKNKSTDAIDVNSSEIFTQPVQQPKKIDGAKNIEPQKIEIDFPGVVNHIYTDKNKILLSKQTDDSSIAISPVQLNNIPLPDSSVTTDTVATAVAITVNKKINVVHINEIEEEDRIAKQNIITAKSLKKSRTKTAGKLEYAGIINFRIYFKN